MENPDTPPQRAYVLAPAMLAVLAVVGLAIAAEILTTAWPIRTNDVTWRFQLGGLILSAAPQWALILMIVLAIGVFGERVEIVRAGAVLCLALAVAVTLIVPLLTLDMLTVRHLQNQSRLPGFLRIGLKVIGIALLLVPALIWTGFRGLAAAKHIKRLEPTEGPGLVLGPPA